MWRHGGGSIAGECRRGRIGLAAALKWVKSNGESERMGTGEISGRRLAFRAQARAMQSVGVGAPKVALSKTSQ
jgi:hypothetical protein